jgi:hypothetical protein
MVYVINYHLFYKLSKIKSIENSHTERFLKWKILNLLIIGNYVGLKIY